MLWEATGYFQLQLPSVTCLWLHLLRCGDNKLRFSVVRGRSSQLFSTGINPARATSGSLCLFVPTNRNNSTTLTDESFQPNFDPTAGDVGFDPVGFSSFIPIDFLREAELKHGRICQLAVVGFAATDLGLHLPGAEHAVSLLVFTFVFSAVPTSSIFCVKLA